MTKIVKNHEKFVKNLYKFAPFTFGAPKHLALKMAIKRNYLTPNTIMELHKAQFQTGLTKIGKMTKKCENLQHFGLKTS